MPRSLVPYTPARKVLLAVALLALLLPASAMAAESGTLTVQPRPVEDLKAVFATVESVRETMARTRIGGTVADLTVREGDKVTVGQVIATVRDPKLPLQLTALDARIQALTAQQHQAELELGRARQLRASGTGTQQRLDDAQAALDVARAQIAAMEAERSVVAQQLQEGEVLAPAAGRVLQVRVIAGAVVMPGEPVAGIATDTYILRLRLPERHARFLKEGDPVLVGQRGLAPVASADPGATALARGAVRQVYPEMAGGRVVADATVSGLGDFFVGERARVYVATGTRDAVVIPPDWLLRRFGTDFVRLADGTEVPVQAGGEIPTVGDRPGGLEILSGLKPGDVIVRPAGS
ncbi:RND family efflux transporter MFP subunit [Azospirillum sp. OGB3]|uniref:efflux RND transporter periplasmic adaptor subunit n=1 Tax=Azospirillum sp. OGB3 TaxID=2587012 RepID=UPI001605D654|nr:efflux RND transporter periplasmic adaptor subunit [Azospirillum sp. OGB3]MBB3264730.1 RND family efflux transporter MFP subunit [Azospirillum sp. OGB3]